MKLSRLELYLEILKVLNQRRSESSMNLLNEFTIDNTMEERLAFLLKQGLIETGHHRDQMIYKNTKKGKNTLRYFNEQESMAFTVDLGRGVVACKKTEQFGRVV